MKVLGYAAFSSKEPLGPFTFDRRELGSDDVLIDIEYCGICHSDIHQVRNEWGSSRFPMVPGHEIVGVVSRVGSGVQKYKVGDKVGVGCLVNSCRECDQCRDGFEQFCPKGVWTYNAQDKDGSITQGGYSKQIVVTQDFVLKIPNNLSLDGAAPLLCAGITTYSPLKHWKTGPGKKVAVLGLGGLGHVAVKIAHAMGAEVTVLSHSMKKAEDAKRLGADAFYATSDKSTFEKLQKKFDLIINTVSAEIDWNDYINLLRRDGALVHVGIPEKAPPPVSSGPLIHMRRSLSGSLIGGIAETQEMLDFCGQHGIHAEIELIPVDRINEAYDRVVKSDVRYRFVIDLKSLK